MLYGGGKEEKNDNSNKKRIKKFISFHVSFLLSFVLSYFRLVLVQCDTRQSELRAIGVSSPIGRQGRGGAAKEERRNTIEPNFRCIRTTKKKERKTERKTERKRERKRERKTEAILSEDADGRIHMDLRVSHLIGPALMKVTFSFYIEFFLQK